MNELVSAKKDLADKSLRLTEQHPDVRAAAIRATAAEAALQRAEEAIQAAQPPPLPPPAPPEPSPAVSAAVAPRATAEAKEKPAAKANDTALVSLETEWLRLNREVTSARQQATQLETRVFQAKMAESSEQGGYAATIAVLDPAFRPAAPSGTPNRTILLLGFVAATAVAIALAMARGVLLDDRLFDASEIEDLGLAPVLGVVPRLKPDKTGRRGLRG
jgi:uncharacterized protein involved in exopolysaccharide biosynthesis